MLHRLCVLYWCLFTVCLSTWSRADEPIRIACVGDSLTAGLGLGSKNTPENTHPDRYPAQLKRHLGSGFDVGSFGHSGATLSRETDLPYRGTSEFTEVQKFEPNIVVIMLGSNDANPSRWKHLKGRIGHELIDLVKYFRDLPSHPEVLVCIPPPMSDPRWGPNIKELRPLIDNTCKENRIRKVDVFTEVINGGANLLQGDKVHPNARGAGIMAKAVERELGKLESVQKAKAKNNAKIAKKKSAKKSSKNLKQGSTWSGTFRCKGGDFDATARVKSMSGEKAVIIMTVNKKSYQWTVQCIGTKFELVRSEPLDEPGSKISDIKNQHGTVSATAIEWSGSWFVKPAKGGGFEDEGGIELQCDE